jgi:hypothetical protein
VPSSVLNICIEYIYLYPGITWKSFLRDNADSVFSIHFKLYASEIDLVQAFLKKPDRRTHKEEVRGCYRFDDLGGHNLSKKIPALHSLLVLSYDSSVLLNPTVSFVKFQQGVELHNYGYTSICFSIEYRHPTLRYRSIPVRISHRYVRSQFS